MFSHPHCDLRRCCPLIESRCLLAAAYNTPILLWHTPPLAKPYQHIIGHWSILEPEPVPYFYRNCSSNGSLFAELLDGNICVRLGHWAFSSILLTFIFIAYNALKVRYLQGFIFVPYSWQDLKNIPYAPKISRVWVLFVYLRLSTL